MTEPTPHEPDPYAAPAEPISFGRPAPTQTGALVWIVAAVVGAVVLGLIAVAAALVLVLGDEPSTDRSVAAGPPGKGIAASELARGVCFDEDRAGTAEDEAGNLRSLPCTGPHQYKTYFTFSLPDEAWPGQSTVDEASEKGCLDAHTDGDTIVGRVSEDDLEWFVPSEDTWGSGDRFVACFVASDVEGVSAS